MAQVHSVPGWSSPPAAPDDLAVIPDQVLETLQHNSLFQWFKNPNFLREIACCMTLRTFAPRDVIIVEGDQAKAMFLLLRGSVDVCSADFERIYATLDQGACFGEIGILFSMPRTATVIARTKCVVASLTVERVAAILPRYPAVEQMLRFEAQERLARLQKCKQVAHRRPSIECQVVSFNGMSARELLKKVSFFQGCPDDFLHMISLSMEPRSYPPNITIIEKGDVGTEVYFIVEGVVEILTEKTPDAAAVARLGHGDVFGELAILLDAPRTAYAQSVTPLELFVLNRHRFFNVCQRYPEIERHLREVADATLRQIETAAHSAADVDTITNRASYAPAQDQYVAADSMASIHPTAVCSTISDYDPMYPSNVSALKTREPKRRPSIAVWADAALSAIANQKEPISSARAATAYKSPLAKTLPEDTTLLFVRSKDRLTSLDPSILSHILRYLDFLSIIQFSAVSKRCRRLLIQRCEGLFTNVDLSTCNKRINDDSMNAIAPLIGPYVRSLSLSHCFHLTDTGIVTLAEHAPHLEALDLNSCWQMTNKSLRVLGASCPHLTKLDISNCRKVSDAGLCDFLARSGDGLTDLALSYCKNITDRGMQAIAVHGASTLTSLNIQRCTKISDDAFMAWSLRAQPLLALKTLTLTDCSFLTDRAVLCLVKAAPNLEHLGLSFCCSLSDSAVEILANLKHLTSLDVSFCGAAVSDASIKKLLKERAETLTALSIRGCVRISGVGLLSAMEPAKLSYLNISQCPCIGSRVKTCLSTSNHVDQIVS